MKKILLLFAFIIGVYSFAQIKVLKNESLEEIGTDNSVGLFKKDNRYTFNYQDINTSNLNTFRSFSFLDLNRDVEALYKMINDGFISPPVNNVVLEFPGDIIELHFAKNYGQPTVQFIHVINKNRKFIGKTQFLTKKQVDKIFGKINGRSKVYENSKIVTTTPASNVNNPDYTGTANNSSTATKPKTTVKKKKKRR